VCVTVPPGGALGRQRAHHPLQSLYVVRQGSKIDVHDSKS
jgi:hypothetical protein